MMDLDNLLRSLHLALQAKSGVASAYEMVANHPDFNARRYEYLANITISQARDYLAKAQYSYDEYESPLDVFSDVIDTFVDIVDDWI